MAIALQGFLFDSVYSTKASLVYSKPDAIIITSPLVDKFPLIIMSVPVTFHNDFQLKQPWHLCVSSQIWLLSIFRTVQHMLSAWLVIHL